MGDIKSALKVRQDNPADLAATVKGFGAAGAPDAGVVTVQGIPNMTPLLVSNVDADVAGVPLGTTAQRAIGTQAGVASGVAAAAAVASLAIPANKTLYVTQLKGGGSGRTKLELLSGADLASGVAIAAPLWTTAAKPTDAYEFKPPIAVAGGVGGTNVLVKGTNEDELAQDLAASIAGYLI